MLSNKSAKLKIKTGTSTMIDFDFSKFHIDKNDRVLFLTALVFGELI